MSNSATLTFDSNSWQGTYINSVTAAPSQTIVNLNVSFTADLTALSGGMPKFQKSVNLFCAGSIPCESFYIPNAPAPYIGTFRLNSIGNAVGQIRTLGGQASIAANNSVIPKTGNYIGTADISGTLRTTYTYDAKTSYQYALDAYTAALGYSDPADRIQLSREAYRQAILLRETSYFGSSQNVNIKLAEYYLRGLSGGYLTHSPSSIGTDGDALNDIPNFLGPVSAPIYNSIKSLGSLLGLVPPGWSTVGGTSDTLSGWYDGVTGKAPQDAIKNHFDGNLQRLPSAPTDGMLLPVIGVKTKILSDANDFIQLFAFSDADSGTTYWLDPQVGKSIIVAGSAKTITEMQIKNLHEGISLSVLVEGQVFELGSSGHFSFSEHGFGGGVDSFALFDQNAGSEFGNYDLGLRFSSTANTVIGLAEIYNVTSVPEPRVSALMAAGLPMLALAAIRRRRHALCQRGMV